MCVIEYFYVVFPDGTRERRERRLHCNRATRHSLCTNIEYVDNFNERFATQAEVEEQTGLVHQVIAPKTRQTEERETYNIERRGRPIRTEGRRGSLDGLNAEPKGWKHFRHFLKTKPAPKSELVLIRKKENKDSRPSSRRRPFSTSPSPRPRSSSREPRTIEIEPKAVEEPIPGGGGSQRPKPPVRPVEIYEANRRNPSNSPPTSPSSREYSRPASAISTAPGTSKYEEAKEKQRQGELHEHEQDQYVQLERQEDEMVAEATGTLAQRRGDIGEKGFVSSLVQNDMEVPKTDQAITRTTLAFKSNLSEFDSGYGSISHPARSAESSEPGIQADELQSHAIGIRSPANVTEDHDILSLVSENDDIGSQISIETTKAQTGQALIYVFLAENPQFRALCEIALTRMDKQRCAGNVRRLLRSAHKNLLNEAKSEGEKAVARLLRGRQARLRISQRLVIQIEKEQDVDEQDKRPDLGTTMKDKLSLEKWLAGVSGAPADLPEQHFEDDDSDDESIEPEAQHEFPFTFELKQYLQESESFKSLLRDFNLWLLPIDIRQVLMTIPRSCIWVSQEQDISLMNLVKAWVEDNTKVKWNWWPLEARKRSLRDHESRLFWRCTCGKRQWMEISAEHHGLLKEVLDLMNDIPLSPHWCRTKRMRVPLITYFTGAFRTVPAAPLASSSTPASRYTPSSLATSTSPSLPSGSQYSAILSNSSSQQSAPLMVSSAPSAAQGASSQTQNHILFGVQGGRRALFPAQVPVYDWSTDESVFRGLRQCYQGQRGWLRLWFSIWRLGHCAVVKFNRLSVERMVHEYRDLPKQLDYQYAPRAGDPDARNPPVSPHLFEALYYTCPAPCRKWVPHGCSSPPNGATTVARFPKRAKCFERDQTSPIWGIEAVFTISAVHVIAYHLILVAGPFIFFGWWVNAHPLDLQNASVPATMAGGALSVLWMISGILTSKETD